MNIKMALLTGMSRIRYNFMENVLRSSKNITSRRQNLIQIAASYRAQHAQDHSILASEADRELTATPLAGALTWLHFRRIHSSATHCWNGDSEADHHAHEQSKSNVVKVKSWPFQLETPFGKLMIKETRFPARIVPTNPHDYPAGDRVFVHLLASVAMDMELDPSSFADAVSNITCSSDKEGIHISHAESSEDVQSSLAWVIKVPTCYDIDVSSTDQGHISVENLENEMCYIKTDKGNISLTSMKSAHVNVSSTSGNISCIKALQGSGQIDTKNNGVVTADRLQGLDFEVSTESGAVHIKDIYSRKAQVSSQTGSVHISNMHTDCNIVTGGNVFAGCVQGSMVVALPGQASFKGYLSCHDDINIQTEKGDIEIRLPEECQSHIDLSGKEVDMDSGLVFLSTKPSDHQTMIGELNGGGVDAKIIARSTEGSITMKTQSWFDSLGLGT